MAAYMIGADRNSDLENLDFVHGPGFNSDFERHATRDETNLEIYRLE